MNAKDLIVFPSERFSLGQDVESGKYFVSIPVNNGLVDYEEYYDIFEAEFLKINNAASDVRLLVDKCRARKNDDRLIVKPGSRRGSPV